MAFNVSSNSLVLAGSTGVVAGLGSKYIKALQPEEGMKNKALTTGAISAASSLVVSMTGIDSQLNQYYPGQGAMIVSSRSVSDGLVFALLEAIRNPSNRKMKRAFYNVLLNTGSSVIAQQVVPSLPAGLSMRRKVPASPLQQGSLTNPSTLSSPGF